MLFGYHALRTTDQRQAHGAYTISDPCLMLLAWVPRRLESPAWLSRSYHQYLKGCSGWEETKAEGEVDSSPHGLSSHSGPLGSPRTKPQTSVLAGQLTPWIKIQDRVISIIYLWPPLKTVLNLSCRHFVTCFSRPYQNPYVEVREAELSPNIIVCGSHPVLSRRLFLSMVNCTHLPYILLVLVLKTVINSALERGGGNLVICLHVSQFWIIVLFLSTVVFIRALVVNSVYLKYSVVIKYLLLFAVLP